MVSLQFPENDIDGDTLLFLIKNFEEFHHLMPQSWVSEEHCGKIPSSV